MCIVECFEMTNFDRFHREAMGGGGGVRGLDSNYIQITQ